MNKDNIAKAAIILEDFLQHYSVDVEEAREVYQACKPLLEQAKNKAIDNPISGGWFHIYLEPGYRLSEFDDLSQAAAEFSVLLEGWSSIEAFRRDFAKIEEQSKQDEIELRDKLKGK